MSEATSNGNIKKSKNVSWTTSISLFQDRSQRSLKYVVFLLFFNRDFRVKSKDLNRDLKEVILFQQNWREKHHAGIYCLEEHIKAPASGFYQNLFWGYVDELLFLLHQLLTFSSVPQSSITIRLCICGPTVLNNRDVLLYYTKGLSMI